jgi:tetratricopeptide (TPR) repeat protein
MQPDARSSPDRPEPSTYDLALDSGERCDWRAAHALLAAADTRGDLDPRGLELLAESARWIGRDDAIIDPLERAHAAYTRDRDTAGAARTALALLHANIDHARDDVAATWLHRAEDLLASLPEGREHALLAWYRARACSARGAIDEQLRHARQALAMALQHGDRSVESLALIEIGHVAASRGEHEKAFTAVERATAIAVSGEAGIYAAGAVFCNAIWLFRCCGEWDRAHHWTESATRWVDRQQVEYFPALCRVHRSEVLRVRGRLGDAEREGELAAGMLRRSIPRYAMIAFAELGEVRRRRGDLEGAMAAFEEALQLGWDPEPGLALTLLARGETAAAFRAIERVFLEPQPTTQCEDRASLLLARARIALAAGQVATAREAVASLERLVAGNPSPWTAGACAEAQGRLALHEERPGDAVDALARARRAWSDLDAPFELASTCSLLAAALERDGDAAGAHLELATARAIFERIGAGFEAAQALRDLDALERQAPRVERPAPSQAAGVQEAFLGREGDYWTLRFADLDVRLKHGRGLDHLARLLAEPEEPRWAIELAADPRSEEGRAADAGDAGEHFDTEARRAYEARARDLEQELAQARRDADPLRIEAIRAEMDALARELAAGVGLGGRTRRAGGATERARQSVTKAIRGAIRRIADACPPLGDHLERSVRTGTSCVFDPGPHATVRWRIVHERPPR